MTIIIPAWVLSTLTVIGWVVLLLLALLGVMLLWTFRDGQFWR